MGQEYRRSMWEVDEWMGVQQRAARRALVGIGIVIVGGYVLSPSTLLERLEQFQAKVC